MTEDRILEELKEIRNLLQAIAAHRGLSLGARRVDDPGWTQEEARSIRARLSSFEDDWNAPGMDAYDRL